MDNKLRVSAVSYSNSLPFVYGLLHTDIREHISLTLDNPAQCASMLLEGKADVGLVPVGVLPLLKDYYLVSDYCIGAVGKVKTVSLFSSVPITEIKNIYLDYQSRTSVQLVKVLAEEYWGITPNWIEAPANYIELISCDTAGVVIGDRAFDLNSIYPYIYDLSEAWMKHTSLPFVFAVWVSLRPLDDTMKEMFNKAFSFGMSNKLESTSLCAQGLSQEKKAEILDYLTNNISYLLDEPKKQGMQMFLDKIKG